MELYQCLRVYLDPMQEYQQPCCYSLVVQKQRMYGSMTWSTMASLEMTNGTIN